MSKRRSSCYFETPPGAPAPLSIIVERQVRYEEVDALAVVWHGRYASFLEEGRAAFGERHGLTYLALYENKILTPIVEMHIEYHQPLRLAEKFQIITELIWSEAARINFQYRIQTPAKLAATAYTVQLLTDANFEVQLTRPKFLEEFCDKWRRGLIS